MPGANLQTCRDRMLFLLQGTYSKDASPRWTDRLLLAAMEDACGRLSDQLPPGTLRQVETLPLVAGQSGYVLDGLVGGADVLSVFRLDGPDYTSLERLPVDEFRADYMEQTVPAGVPRYWSMDLAAGKVYVAPAPVASVSDGLRVYMDRGQSALDRLWCSEDAPGVLGLGAVHGEDPVGIVLSEEGALSPQRTGLATDRPYMIQAGDEIGIWPRASTAAGATRAQLLSTEAEPPRRWYHVAAVSDAMGGSLVRSVSLSPTYEGDSTMPLTGSVTDALPFVVAQVPGVLKVFPNMMDAFCRMACAYLLEMDSPQIAEQWRAAAGMAVVTQARIREGGSGHTFSGRPGGTRLSGITRRF